jgi:hypothetical protein
LIILEKNLKYVNNYGIYLAKGQFETSENKYEIDFA